ncbi:hypothetical protein FB451DRAFT_1401844 [Mycena latifolia]|nr:hypothetical protein FB451DRAFT_1401844 [Mycena latifolia]
MDGWPQFLELGALILITHSKNLCATSQPEIAISIAEEAVAVYQAMPKRRIESSSQLPHWTRGREDYTTADEELEAQDTRRLFQAYFVLATALSAVGRHLEAYEASKHGFQAILRLKRELWITVRLAFDFEPEVNGFVGQLCKVADGDGFSLDILADDVVLFRNLACIYPKEFSSLFLRLLYAYVYLSQQPSPDFGKLQIFLEPDSDSPTPIFDSSTNFDAFDNSHGGIIGDAVWAFYLQDTPDVFPLLKNLFMAHFDQAIIALRDITSDCIETLDRELDDIAYRLLPVVTRAQQLTLLEIVTTVVGHFRTVSKTSSPQTRFGLRDRISFTDVLWNSCWGFWIVGLLDDAKASCDEALEYLRRSSSDPNHNEDQDSLREWCMCRTFVLCDMARIPEAIEAVQDVRTTRTLMDGTQILHYCMIQTRILQRTGRKREALQLLKNIMADVEQLYEENLGYHGHILLTDLAAARVHAGQFRKAVKDGNRVVTACQENMDQNDGEEQKCALTHSLTVLSDCLAAVGMNDEALFAAKEATSIYTRNASHMWGNFCYTIRRQELGANTFYSLSLQLASSGQLEEARANAEKAIELYRELVSLSPRHLPNFATSLRNLASILALRRAWCIDESISACEEAVGILRQVADNEPYFLGALAEALDQLAGYLLENGDAERAAAVTSEAVEVRRKTECLPPQPEFLFSQVEMDSEDEDDGWATATESEEYHDAAAGIETVVSKATSTSSQELPSATQAIEAEVKGGSSLSAVLQVAMPSTDDASTSPVASKGEERAARDIGKKGIADMLRKLLRVELSSTPMVILWWMLLGVLSVLVVILGVVLVVI